MTIDSLLEIITKMDELHRELIILAKHKTPVLIKNRVDELNAIVSKENKIIKQITELDRQRIQATGEYLISRGYNPDPRVSVSHLIKIIFKAEEKKALMAAQQKLLALITELKKLNEANQMLIEQSLAFINFSVDLLIDDPSQDIFYKSPAGRGQGGTRSGMFDTRA